MSSTQSIFISYRRSDSRAETERIYDGLVDEFGRDRVFKDADDIPLGADLAKHLEQVLGRCKVVLVIIGKTWASVTEADGTLRLNNPDDFVRREVELALKRDIPVIPVLLEGAIMPRRDQLPISLHPLLRRKSANIAYDPDFHTHMRRLVTGMKKLLQEQESNLQSQSARKEIDYTRLKDLLRSGNWEAADDETYALMVQATSNTSRGYCAIQDFQHISRNNLMMIDRLWVEYSSGRFGFSVQAKIYSEVNPHKQQVGRWDDDFQILDEFAYRVGWRKQGSYGWISSRDLTFNTTAPKGHLPSLKLNFFMDVEGDDDSYEECYLGDFLSCIDW